MVGWNEMSDALVGLACLEEFFFLRSSYFGFAGVLWMGMRYQ